MISKKNPKKIKYNYLWVLKKYISNPPKRGEFVHIGTIELDIKNINEATKILKKRYPLRFIYAVRYAVK